MKVSDYMEELKKAFEDIVKNNKAIEKAVNDQNIGISGFKEILDMTKNESVGVSDEDFKEAFRFLLNSDSSERLTVWGDVARGSIVQLLKETHVSEFVNKYMEYKDKQNEIKVGDVVKKSSGIGIECIVTRIPSITSEWMYVLYMDGSSCKILIGDAIKTGKHYDSIDEFMNS